MCISTFRLHPTGISNAKRYESPRIKKPRRIRALPKIQIAGGGRDQSREAKNRLGGVASGRDISPRKLLIADAIKSAKKKTMVNHKETVQGLRMMDWLGSAQIFTCEEMWVEGIFTPSGSALRYKANKNSDAIRRKIKIALVMSRSCDDETIGN